MERLWSAVLLHTRGSVNATSLPLLSDVNNNNCDAIDNVCDVLLVSSVKTSVTSALTSTTMTTTTTTIISTFKIMTSATTLIFNVVCLPHSSKLLFELFSRLQQTFLLLSSSFIEIELFEKVKIDLYDFFPFWRRRLYYLTWIFCARNNLSSIFLESNDPSSLSFTAAKKCFQRPLSYGRCRIAGSAQLPLEQGIGSKTSSNSFLPSQYKMTFYYLSYRK